MINAVHRTPSRANARGTLLADRPGRRSITAANHTSAGLWLHFAQGTDPEDESRALYIEAGTQEVFDFRVIGYTGPIAYSWAGPLPQGEARITETFAVRTHAANLSTRP